MAVLLTGALLVLVACTSRGGGDAGAPTALPSAGGGAGSGKHPHARGPLAVPADAADGGTITVLTRYGQNPLDPTQAYYTDSTEIMNLVTRALTQYAYDPETNGMVLEPDMATDLGRPNEDNTEWTFTLKDGLKYEDGTPVKAEDVAYAIARSFAIEELPDGPTYQLQFFLDGDKYKGPYKDKNPYKGVEVNGNDITIKMSRPFPEMDYYASFPVFTGIPKDKDTGTEYGDHPLATGPYMFGDYEPGSSLTLVKNPFWDPATDPGRIQAVDTWEFRFLQDGPTVENTIARDVGAGPTSVSADNVSASTYKRMSADSPERVVVGTSPCTYLWYLDMTKITDIDVRKAIGYAFPYVDAWKAGGLIPGVTIWPGTTLLPPGMDGRVEYDVLGIGGERTDSEKAHQLLEKAHAVGFEIKFHYATDDGRDVAATDQIVRGLEAAGFSVTPIATTSTQLGAADQDYDSPVNVRAGGWCSDWPSGGSWFPAQWSGDLVGVDKMPNPSSFDEPDADARQAAILAGPADAAPAGWGELDRFIEETYYPAVVTGYSGTTLIRGSDVGGMHVDDVRGMPTLQTMYLTR